MAAIDQRNAMDAIGIARPQSSLPTGVGAAMKASGDTGKGGEKRTKPAEKPAAEDKDRAEKGPQSPPPPAGSARAAAAKSNPLKSSAGGDRAGSQESPDEDKSDETTSDKDTNDDTTGDPKPSAGSSGGAPELRISARMLSAQPSAKSPVKSPAADTPPTKSSAANSNAEPPPPTAGKSKYRRRVKSLARPVEPEVINPLRIVWPRANSRSSARIASRYGLVGLVLALIWVTVAIPADTINKAISFSSSSAAVAVVIGTVAALALIVVAYYQQSRLAALLSLVGVVTLIVLNYQSHPVTWAEIAGQIVLVYMLLHGVHGTIAYHIFGRRKRRRQSSGYEYKND